MSETLLGRLIGVVVRPKLCVLAKTNPAGAGKQREGKEWVSKGEGWVYSWVYSCECQLI